MLIDFHAHIYPDDTAEKVISSMENFYGVKRRHDAVLSSLLDSVKLGGFDHVVVLPVFTKPEHIELNRWYASLASTSNGAVIPFGGFHPENDPSELMAVKELGLKGIKLQPNAQRFYPDDPALFPIYETAQELGLIIVFHAGNEASGPPAVYSQPDCFPPVLSAFPGLTVILPHLGGYQAWDAVSPLFTFENAYFDTAYLPGKIDEDVFVELVERASDERLLFGTDFPFRDHLEEISWVERVLGKRRTAKLHENARRLLDL